MGEKILKRLVTEVSDMKCSVCKERRHSGGKIGVFPNIFASVTFHKNSDPFHVLTSNLARFRVLPLCSLYGHHQPLLA